VVVSGIQRARPGAKVTRSRRSGPAPHPRIHNGDQHDIAVLIERPSGERHAILIIILERWRSRLPWPSTPIFAGPPCRARPPIPGPAPEWWPTPSRCRSSSRVNGVQDMLYMQSTSASDGTTSLVITFKVAPTWNARSWCRTASPPRAQLPLDVQNQGAVTKKVSTAILQVVNSIPLRAATTVSSQQLR